MNNKNRKNSPDIIYENNEIIVINKPAGLLSIASESEKLRTAYRELTEYVRAGGNPRARVFIVHRLDRDTSGVLLFAKNEKIKRALQENWNKIVINRGYTAVVEGKLKAPEGTIRTFLFETKTRLMYSGRSNGAGDGLEAITKYKVIAEAPAFSLLDIRLLTGRKNQIRVHMLELGNPVTGDKKYGATQNPLGRLGLHAHLLEFTHPITTEIMKFSAPVPREFSKLFNMKEENK